MRAHRGLCLGAVLFALPCLGGCGGSSSGETQATTSTAAKASQATTTAPAQGGQGQAKAPQSSPPEPDPPIAARRTPGSKAVAPGVPVTKGADNSVQAFGAEGQEGEAAQAYAELRSYLAALGAGEYAKACEVVSSQFREELEKLIEGAKVPEGQQKPQGCAQTLAALLGGASAKALAPITAVGELLSFRVGPDGYAYLIFRGEGGEAMFIAMAKEGGKWRVNVPKPEAFQSASQGQGGAQ
jgi:hypothetical protein